MIKVDQMWYFLLICYDFATVVILFFRAVLISVNSSQQPRFPLRYHGRWIDNAWKLRSYAGALKENPINLYIF